VWFDRSSSPQKSCAGTRDVLIAGSPGTGGTTGSACCAASSWRESLN
jgi:hypothetical protein